MIKNKGFLENTTDTSLIYFSSCRHNLQHLQYSVEDFPGAAISWDVQIERLWSPRSNAQSTSLWLVEQAIWLWKRQFPRRKMKSRS